MLATLLLHIRFEFKVFEEKKKIFKSLWHNALILLIG